MMLHVHVHFARPVMQIRHSLSFGPGGVHNKVKDMESTYSGLRRVCGLFQIWSELNPGVESPLKPKSVKARKR